MYAYRMWLSTGFLILGPALYLTWRCVTRALRNEEVPPNVLVVVVGKREREIGREGALEN